MAAVRGSRVFLAGVLSVTLLLPVLAGCAPEAPAPEEEPPGASEPVAPGTDGAEEIPATDTERALVESKCSRCHSLDQVWAAQMDAAGWESTVKRMETNGLQVTDEERQRIIDYLAGR